MSSRHSGNVDPHTVRAHVENAAESVGRVWPLYSDVAANPLSGFEDLPFEEAVAEAERLFDGRGYPRADQFRRAWEEGDIDPDVLARRLEDEGITESPEKLLDRMDAEEAARGDDGERADGEDLLDRLLSKWLAAFLDQGQTAWPMPNREEGFYAAWRRLAKYDGEIPASSTPVAAYHRERLTDLPETAMEALYAALSDHPEERWEDIFEHHLAALPGWTGLVRQRQADENNPWQDAYPITLVDYLAVRLILAKHLGEPIEPDRREADEPDETPLPEVWLDAWEESYRRDLVAEVDAALSEADAGGADEGRPAAQLVFCIDTRSEIIRRHVEQAGPYETHGYAGFFGVPIRHSGYGETVSTDSCPVIADPKHRIDERPAIDRETAANRYAKWDDLTHAGHKLMKSLKNDVAAAFGFVEGAGGFFGAALTARTLLPSALYDLDANAGPPRQPEFCEPALDRPDDDPEGDLPRGISTEQKAFYAEAAFDLMGWDEFAPIVVFAGHASQTVNNPYESSIDCGACAGSSGVPNARALAAICNDPEVREILRDRGIEIPSDTAFVAAEHNTTTDEVTLFPDDELERERRDELERLRRDLGRAQAGAAAERLEAIEGDAPDGADAVRETQRRAADWAEPRPELGLSGNAGFVIGPHELTGEADLEGRAFLHTYDWSADPDGDALENIMVGPLVVTQMISAQYYFSTVDNAVFGSGSKITHNPVGKVGVYQGNGGDLMTGLPFQSLHDDDGRAYHDPLRLTALIRAPVDRVEDVLRRNEDLRRLFDNDWLNLTVMDPERGDDCFHYQEDLEWDPAPAERHPVAPSVTAD